MTSKVKIISEALVLLGEAPINNVNLTDPDPIIQATLNMYESLCDTILSGFDWIFATQIFTLVPLVTPPPLDVWSIAYQKPAECLRIIRVIPNSNFYPIGDQIWSNIPDLLLGCVVRINEEKFPPYLATYVASALAHRVAETITRDENISVLMKDISEKDRIKARATDSLQRPNIPMLSDPITAARNSNGRRNGHSCC